MDSTVHEIARIARLGGAKLRQLLGTIERSEVELKGPKDLVTHADRAVETIIAGELARSFPGIGILGEELSPERELAGEVWLVDPIDGTTNFVHGHPIYAISIALARGRELIYGVIYAPSMDELFIAQRGAGARLNDRPLAVSSATRLSEALLATGFAALRRPGGRDNIPHFAALVRRAEGIRRAGAACLDLAYVAAGRLDGYWEFNLSSWDVAAGSLLVLEAGGKVTDLEGGGTYLNGKSILASNGSLHEEMLEILTRVERESAG